MNYSEQLKEMNARDLAETLAQSDDTDVEPEDIATWDEYDVYEWLELGWDREWDGESWDYVGEE